MWTFYAAGALVIVGLLTCWALVRINQENNAEARRRQEEEDMQELREDIARRRAAMYVMKGGKS